MKETTQIRPSMCKNIINILIPLIITVFLSSSTTAHANQKPKRIVYTGTPIKLDLSLNEEQRLTFPDAKLIGASVNDKLINEGFLSVDIVNNEVYLTALKPFKKDRNMFMKEGSSDIYLVDIAGTQRKFKPARLVIVKGEDRYAISDKDKKIAPEEVIAPLKNKKTPTAGYKTLIGFATREVYAPDRLRGGVKGIYRESITTNRVFNLIRNNKVTTQPIASWRSGKLHVIAVSVKNITNEKVSLSPLNIRGQWKAASFYRSSISQKGTAFDNTTLFLISDKTFLHGIESNPMIRVARR